MVLKLADQIFLCMLEFPHIHAETPLIGHANCHLKWQALNAKDLDLHDCVSIES